MAKDRFASPAAAALAIELGLDGVEIVGTGRAGKVTAEDVRRAAPPGPPSDLGTAGQELWGAVWAEWDLRSDEDRLLLAACRTVDELGRMEATLADADLVVEGSKGQVRPHPLIAEVRQHRLALRQLLRSLGIEDAEGAEGSDAAAARSTAGRKLARQRWDRRGAA